MILDEDLEDDQDRGNGDQERDEGDGDDQLERGNHGAKVSPDVEGIGHCDQHGGDIHDGRWKRLLDEGRQAFASSESQARSQFLDRSGQRKGDRNRPEHGETELGAELRVGADSRRIVVGGSRDEPGADVS